MSYFYTQDGRDRTYNVGRIVTATVAALLLFVVLMFAINLTTRELGRYQKRADARNQVEVTHILIKRAEQQARINRAQIEATKAEAEKRIEEAKGIRAAQDEINATLTDKYLKHEAIQAQRAIATSGKNNTVIYVPSGDVGTPTLTAQAGTGK